MAVNAAASMDREISAAPLAATSAADARYPVIRIMTLDERLEDMRAFGREICKTPQTALDFLKSVGIVDASGQLAEPFRS